MHAPPPVTPIEPTRGRWESAVEPLLDATDGRLWRAHSDAVNGALVVRWLRGDACGRVLKTDLFDEAMDAGLYPLLRERARDVVAIDIASSVLASARARHPAIRIVAADVRRLPFADGSFDAVVSNSTLDHFETRDELRGALAGLCRVLRSGGRLVLTLDNLRHPAIALRNALPYRWLERIGLVPYPVGATMGPGALERALREAGFEIVEMTAILHCPRALAVRRARAIERHASPASRARFLKRLGRWESMGAWPTRYLTGHYVAVLARKP